MTAPDTHKVILNPPRPGMHHDQREIYKYLYELWKRTGGYNSSVKDLTGLSVSTAELNTLVGIRVDETVQGQLNLKANTSDLGSMAYQNADSVAITGGTIDVSCGTSTDRAAVGGVLSVDTDSYGNTGATETTLAAFELKANSLNIDTSFIKLSAWGTFATNANNKRIRVKIGSSTLLDTTALALNGGIWSITGKIIRKTSGSGVAILELMSDNSLIVNKPFYSSFSENFATNLNVFCTGEAVADNDIVEEGLIIEWNYK